MAPPCRWSALVLAAAALCPAGSSVASFFGGPAKPAVPPGGLACDDGWTAIPAGWIGDDYCDCRDGADEPTTAACAGIPLARFTCANVGYEATAVPASRVGDGSCDCCDGSDEAAGVCEHSCDVEAARLRAERERFEKARRVGARKRRAYVAQAAERRQRETDELNEARETQRTSLPETQRLKALVKDLEGARKKRHDERRDRRDAEYATTGLAALEEADLAAATRAAVYLAAATAEIEALTDAVVSKAGLPESLTDSIDDVEVLSVGVDASEAFRDGDVATLESSCAKLAAALRLVDVPTVDDARALARAVADAANQGLDAQQDNKGKDGDEKPEAAARSVTERLAALDALASKLVKPPVASDDDDDDGGALDAARTELAEAEKAKKAADEAVRRLSPDEQADFGPDDAFFPLKGRCFKTRAAKYSYELCPFDTAKQDHTNIGRWDAWDQTTTPWSWRFTRGQHCAGHGSRELTVRVECGEAEELLDVAEAQVCKYEAVFRTPAACPALSDEELLLADDDDETTGTDDETTDGGGVPPAEAVSASVPSEEPASSSSSSSSPPPPRAVDPRDLDPVAGLDAIYAI